MKINVDALAKAFFREWETTVLPADFPDELNIIIKVVEHFTAQYEDYDDLPLGLKQKLSQESLETIFLNKHDENQLRILHDAEEDLYVLKEELQKKDVPAEEIRKIFKTVMEDIV